MVELFGEIASCSPSQVEGSYIYSVLGIAGDRLAALSSADDILLLDPAGLKVTGRIHDGVSRNASCMTNCENAKDIVICAGGDGVVALFDVRTERRASSFKLGWSSSQAAQLLR
jgi:hypothetical protein